MKSLQKHLPTNGPLDELAEGIVEAQVAGLVAHTEEGPSASLSWHAMMGFIIETLDLVLKKMENFAQVRKITSFKHDEKGERLGHQKIWTSICDYLG